jgi:hypothetical protein
VTGRTSFEMRPSSGQQEQFLQLHGLQRQPPLVQLQVHEDAFFSIVLSIVRFPFCEALIRTR